MCGPAFCAYRISQDVRDMAAGDLALQAISEEASEGMRAKAQEFRKNGGRLYIATESNR
jgi:phosphomethylpyrimidine synthase